MTDTKTAIMDLAEKLIRTKGYQAFSYKDISAPLKIKNAAVHYHFPTKADLGLAIIERTRAQFKTFQQTAVSLAPTDQLKAFIDIYRDSQKRDMVCFMGAMGSSYNILPEVMQTALTAASKEIETWVQTMLRKGQTDGHFHFNETVEEKTQMIITALLSSLILENVMQKDVLSAVDQAILKNM